MADSAPASSDERVPLDTIPISPEAHTGDKSEGSSDGPHGEDDTVTVFHDSSNFNVKHPLMHKWTLWFTKPPSGKVCQSPFAHIWPQKADGWAG